jgi:DNA repair protein SbcD/Mre11
MIAIEKTDLVFIGDVHLGRRPVGLDDTLSRLKRSAHDLSPAAALSRVVARLEEQPPRALIFAGDLVDRDDDQWEAYSILEREIQRLKKAGVPVYAVAGNHDGIVLPRLVDRVQGVNLLGAGGEWERIELPGPGPAIDLLGWSFPSKSVATCPLDGGEFESALRDFRPEALKVGVLHCDLDAAHSRYAPVSRARLESAGLDAWFLGHVHAPSDLSSSNPIGYLGSLVGLDVGELGPRGPWRVRFEGGEVKTKQLSFGPIRWEQIDVELSEEDALEEDIVHACIQAAVNERIAADSSLGSAHCEVVVVRVDLSGNLLRRDGVRDLVASSQVSPLDFNAGGVSVIVQRVRDTTRAAVNLEDLSQEPTPIGRVASKILSLRKEEDADLLNEAEQIVERVRMGNWDLDDEGYPLPKLPDLLERAAWRLLNAMLDQRQGAQSK